MSSRSVVVVVAVCLVSLASAAEFASSPEHLAAKSVQVKPIRNESPQQTFDISKLTPEQKQLLAMRIELVRRRRAEIAAAVAAHPGAQDADNSDDLDGANTYGFGVAAALPFLGLYGLGLGGLGVGLGPLAYAGLLG